MEFNQLRAFLAVLDSGSLQAGGKQLQVSRSTVHTRIAALEQSLQMELFVRTHRGVEATEFARHFAERARGLLREADALTQLAARERGEVLGELRVRFTVGLPPKLHTIFPPLFHRRYPHIKLWIEVVEDPARDVPEDIDFVVHFGPRVPSGPFNTFVLARFDEHLIASRRYLDAHGRPTTLAELAGHRLLCWYPPGADRCRLPLRDGGALEVSPAYATNDPFVLHLMSEEGQGVVFTPDANTPSGPIDRSEIELVLPELVGREAAVHVLVPQRQAATPRSRAAVRLLRELVRELLQIELGCPACAT